MNKLLKYGLSSFLAFSLVLSPASFALAGTDDESHTVSDTGTVQYNTEATGTKTEPQSAVDYGEIKKTVDKKASILTSLYGVTSVQYALIDNGEITLTGQSGVNDKAAKTSLTNDTMYGIGSVSKIFTTAAVMKLVEQGKVNLDAAVVSYIPEFTMADSRYKEITVRMLLNHSSGLMGSTLQNAMLFDDSSSATYDDFLDSLKTSRLKADPGEFSVYCNDGFSLAELLVEKVSGISFTDYIKDNFSLPLKLEGTKTPNDIFDEGRLAKAYSPVETKALPTDNINMIGAGGMYSTAEDLCYFSQIFMEDSVSDILSDATARTMRYPEYKTDLWPEEGDSTFAYGLGWDSIDTYPFNEYGIRALSKGGDTLIYHGNFTVLPEENIAVAVLSSGGASLFDQLLSQEILLQTLKAKGTINEIIPDKTFTKPVKLQMPQDLKKYEGYYGYYGGIIKAVVSDDGTLTMSNLNAPGAGEQKFVYTGNGRFYYSDGSTYVSFVEESNNETYLFSAGYVLYPSIGQFASSGYQAQKLKDNPISEALKAVWEKRNNKNYYLVNEKYTSQVYASSGLASKIILPEEPEGYCMNAAIIDENTARVDYRISELAGRDIHDLTFFTKDGAEYLNAGGSIGISEDAIKLLSAKNKFTCKIQEDGYAQWFKIGKESADRKIKVTIPTGAAFALYDEKGNSMNYSYISGKNTVTLPLDGHIVFIGAAGTEFTVTYLK